MEPLPAVAAVAELRAPRVGSLQRTTVPTMRSAKRRSHLEPTLAPTTAPRLQTVSPATATPSATQVWRDAALTRAAFRGPGAPTTSAPSTATVRAIKPARATAHPTWHHWTTPAFPVIAASMAIADLAAI